MGFGPPWEPIEPGGSDAGAGSRGPDMPSSAVAQARYPSPLRRTRGIHPATMRPEPGGPRQVTREDPGGHGEAHVPAEQPTEGPPPRLPAPHGHPGGQGDPQRPASQGPSPAVGLIWRIGDRATFAALRRERRRVRRGPITLTWLPGDEGHPPRVAYAVSRKVGGAVVRNRLRRRLRAVMLELAPLLRPGAYLLGAGSEAASVPYRELRRIVTEALDDLAARAPSP